MFRPKKDGKFYRLSTDNSIPKELVASGGNIAQWFKEKVLKVFSALYIADDFRLYLFSEPSNNALTPYSYFYNERQFQNIKHDIRPDTKVLVNETFDAVFSKNFNCYLLIHFIQLIY